MDIKHKRMGSPVVHPVVRRPNSPLTNPLQLEPFQHAHTRSQHSSQPSLNTQDVLPDQLNGQGNNMSRGLLTCKCVQWPRCRRPHTRWSTWPAGRRCPAPAAGCWGGPDSDTEREAALDHFTTATTVIIRSYLKPGAEHLDGTTSLI